MASRRKMTAARIAAMLGEGRTVAEIAQETGATERTVYRHQSALRHTASNDSAEGMWGREAGEVAAMPATPAQAPQEALIGLAYANGMSKGEIAALLGISPEDVEIDESAKLRFAAKRVEARTRIHATKPDKWEAMVLDRETEERRQRESTDVPRETVINLIRDIFDHQTLILSETDVGYWIDWFKTLILARYPDLGWE